MQGQYMPGDHVDTSIQISGQPLQTSDLLSAGEPVCGLVETMCGISDERNGLLGAFRRLLYDAVVSKRLLGYVR